MSSCPRGRSGPFRIALFKVLGICYLLFATWDEGLRCLEDRTVLSRDLSEVIARADSDALSIRQVARAGAFRADAH